MKGFTLIEVLLATLILAILGMLTAGSLQATFRTDRMVEAKTALQEIGTAAIYKVGEDLGQTFQVASPRPKTLFRGEDNLDRDRIEFTAMVHPTENGEERSYDQAEITYEVVADSQNPQLNQLRRRQMKYLDGQPNSDGDFSVLARNVVAFNLEYYDGQKYVTAWDIRSADRMNKLPRLIKIALRLRDNEKREEDFETTVEIPMSDDIQVERAVAPGGTPGGPAPGQRGTPTTPPPGRPK